MAQFPRKPQLSQGESPSMYDRQSEDNAFKSNTDGGYQFRRPKFTRRPRQMLKTGFIKLPHSDYLLLQAFYDAHLTTTAFTWFDQLRGDILTVYFDKFAPSYQGVGENRKWTIQIEMMEI